MSGRPDYDAGDLVAHGGEPHPEWPAVGSVWLVEKICGPNEKGDFGAHLAGLPIPNAFGWQAEEFRRIDPKPPEFWTGTVSADAGERVTA